MSGRASEAGPGRRELAERIFLAALDRGETERTSFVARECEGDDELRRRVFSLLLVHERTGPLDRLGADAAALWAEVLDGEAADDPMAPDEAQQSRLEPGMRLGRHEIRARIGAGGMGEVFRAIDPRLGREVAVKVIARRIGDHPEALARFESEARAASALNHPNIVTVYDIGEQEGFPYIVMELVEGASLRELLGEPMALERILELGGQIASGLAAAHARGVVHRDLKPENVLLDRRGTVRILDFGVARFAHGSEDATLSLDSDGSATAAGALIGTMGYMAPEAIRCEPVDARADQFALGAILYEMATGERAFRRATAAETLVATLHEEPPPLRERAPALPPALATVVERCLAKDRGRRFADTEEVQRALAAAARPAPPRRPPSGLPTPATRLVGRRAELHRLQNLVLEARVRLLTLTGTGGSGKTRLAIEAAHELAPSFPGGVYFVPLAAIGEPELVAPAVARALGGIEADGGEELSDLVRRTTETDGPALLVLDNFEQVVEAAPAIGELVAACPGLTVLVTSRELLHLSMEHGFPLAPLELPPAGRSLPVDALAAVPAVALFVERARMADPAFTLDAANAETVAELCRRFDGLPLALALAAARVRMMTPEAMLRRLEKRLSILTGGPRDLPDRQRSLRAAMDWSYELLTPAEQTVFRRLSVFVGGFTLEAAEAVADPFARLDDDLVSTVESLLDRSLLLREPAAGGEPRFHALETVREYALERMQAEEDEAALRRAHAAYFLVLAEEAGAAAAGAEGSPWSERLERERGNLRAALKWAVAEDEGEWGLRLARGLFPFWERGQGISEGRRHLADLLALPSTQGVDPLRAHALFCAGVLASNTNDRPADIDYQRRSLALYRELDNLWGQAAALNAIGINYTDRGEYDRAHECYEECLALWERLGESDGAARSLSNFAYVLRKQGELDRSRQLYRDAAAMFQRLGDETSAAWEVSHEADAARDQGDPESGALYERALDAFRELDQPWGTASVLVELAEAAERGGDLAASRARYTEALATFDRLGHPRGVARVLEGLALVSAREGDDAAALRLAGTAAALRERTSGKRETGPDRQDALDALREESRRRLGDDRADALWTEGRETPPDRLVPELLARD